MIQIANQNNDKSFLTFLNEKVSFHNTMVDRITSQRDGSNGLIPRAEPVPAKALVIEDLDSNLPPCFSTPELKSKFGVVVRTLPNQLKGDIALKLRVANGTHTAIAHVMALTRLLTTDELSKKQEEDSSSRGSAQILMTYLDSMFDQQILVAGGESFGKEETEAVYQDWRKRLIHAHFGLSAFFITQNGAAKGGIRISPTVRDLITSGKVRRMNFPVFCHESWTITHHIWLLENYLHYYICLCGDFAIFDSSCSCDSCSPQWYI
jgi:mannitol-1-phosphate/altronate dehydrogenase